MSAETSPNNSNIDTFRVLFREDPQHKIFYVQTANALNCAGEKIKNNWQSLKEGGFVSAMMSAEMSCEPEPLVLELDEKEYSYDLTYEGSTINSLVQPIDLFRLTNNEDASPDSVAFIELATYKGTNQRFSQLTYFSVKDEDISASSQSFHFNNGYLVAVEQVTQPGFIFSELLPPDEKQSIVVKLGYSQVEQNVKLIVSCGIHYQKTQQHYYRNIGGDLITTQNLQIIDPYCGDLEIFYLFEDGEVITSSLNLPQAIVNIGNFIPAGTNLTI